jgi:ankyrin repeat protein
VLLLGQGGPRSNCDVVDDGGDTPLHVACRLPTAMATDALRILLAAPAAASHPAHAQLSHHHAYGNVNIRDANGLSALDIICGKPGQVSDAVTLLLEAGADCDMSSVLVSAPTPDTSGLSSSLHTVKPIVRLALAGSNDVAAYLALLQHSTVPICKHLQARGPGSSSVVVILRQHQVCAWKEGDSID